MSQITGRLDIRILAMILAIAMLAAWQLGLWMGRRLRRKGRSKPSKFDDASMALLGLLLAFTFGTSISKHDQRVIAVVTDSNAISDLYTCATLIKEPARSKLQAIIQQYVQTRLALAGTKPGGPDLEQGLDQSDQMLSEMTGLVRQALTDGTPIAVSLTNALNAVESNQALRLAAHRDRLHPTIVFLLFASAIITTLLIGREQGSADSFEFAGTLCFILLVTIAIYVTLGLNLPQSGFVRVNQEPMERLFASMPK